MAELAEVSVAQAELAGKAEFPGRVALPAKAA
jgi:hypothetical protein